MSAIGILGGMGPQASTKLYELLINGAKKYTPDAVDDNYPEIVLLNVPVPNFISNKNELPKAKQILIERTKLLEQAGCSVNSIACNTAHILLPELQAVTKVPFLPIPVLVAKRIELAGFKRVGMLATPTTLTSTLYDEAIGDIAEIVRPDIALAKIVEGYIYKQLDGSLSEAERNKFRRMVASFKKQNKLDAVILACTELSLVYGQTDEPVILDTLQILSDELMAAYFVG